ncbi:hypothetical protein H072_3670 [Dactylellina haptotyla CBS 200.50]|uniref:F-box domain-containing protein n=1 Tax=Dactylellina haptotyla (strain CBS 200.50) TaxID=1284197 RepID=S8AMP2_DACHA|nr:hypothetical protein H072_3670 [Dactylellina haptotyla CBS 200.50]
MASELTITISSLFLEIVPLDLPAELWLEIYSYLPLEQLKALSYCSKRHRQCVTLDLRLFKHLKLSEESIAAFDGGKFTGLGARVTDVTFDKLITPTAGGVTNSIKLLRKYCDALHLFPNIQGIRLPFSATKWFEWKIPIAIWFRLSEYPWYPDLKRFSVEPTLFATNSPEWHHHLAILKPCCPEDLEFLKLSSNRKHVRPKDKRLGILSTFKNEDIPLPVKLEEVTTRLFGWADYPLGPHGLNSQFKRANEPFYFFFQSQDTLKRVKLHCPALAGGYVCECWRFSRNPPMQRCPVPPFSAVTEFWLVLDAGNPCDAVGFTRKVFPNVRKLRIDTPWNTEIAEGMFEHMAYLEQLEDVRVPWPNFSYGESHVARALPSHLRELVNSWVPSLPGLRVAEFASEFEPAEDDYYYRYKNVIPTGRSAEICRIVVGEDDERKCVRREEGNRFQNQKFRDRGNPLTGRKRDKGRKMVRRGGPKGPLVDA